MTHFLRDLLSIFTSDEENRLPTTTHLSKEEEDGEEEEYFEAEYNDEDDDYLVQEADDEDEDDDDNDEPLSGILNTLTSDMAPQYREDRATLKQVYMMFRREIPIVNPDAFQYLGVFDIREAKHGVFPRIVFSEMRPMCSAKPIANAPDTFLVNKRLDHIYGRVIESALLGGSVRQEGERLFHKRARALEVCQVNHLDDERGCPLDWVVYTKMNSAFYQFCSDQLVKHNPYINYQINAIGAIKYERLSFYLVLLMCGEFLDGKECHDFTSITLEHSRLASTNLQRLEYGEINQWLKVPLWFLDLWLASQTI